MSIQNYYTKQDLAIGIGYLVKKHFYSMRGKSVLDLCAGAGNFAQGILCHFNEDKPKVHYVEPDEEALPALIKRRSTIGKDQVYAMTGEEFALTHAQAEMVDLVVFTPHLHKDVAARSLESKPENYTFPRLNALNPTFCILLPSCLENICVSSFPTPTQIKTKPERP